MDEFVLSRNVARFKDLLQQEGNQSQRAILQRLLAEEEARLAAIRMRWANAETGPDHCGKPSS